MQNTATFVSDHEQIDQIASQLAMVVGGRPHLARAICLRAMLSIAVNDLISAAKAAFLEKLPQRQGTFFCGRYPYHDVRSGWENYVADWTAEDIRADWHGFAADTIIAIRNLRLGLCNENLAARPSNKAKDCILFRAGT